LNDWAAATNVRRDAVIFFCSPGPMASVPAKETLYVCWLSERGPTRVIYATLVRRTASPCEP